MIAAVDEVETKLDAHPALVLPSLDGVVDGACVAAADPVVLRATYWDTPDLRLVRAGVTLRHRVEPDGQGWQLKLPDRSSPPGALARTEIHLDGGASRPPAEAVALLRPYTRGAPLTKVARLRTRRAVMGVTGPDDTLLAEVCDDEVSVYDGRRLVSRFREIEVEAAAAVVRDALTSALCAAGAEPAAQQPKLVRALGPPATRPADVPIPPAGPPDPRQPVGQVVSRALLIDLERMIRHEPGTRRGRDPEELHQMRVATRRLRSTLRTFRPLLDQGWADGLRRRLRGLAAALGEVRDLDVLMERVDRDAAALDPEDAAATAPVVAALHHEREDARDRLLAVLDGDAHLRLLDDLVRAAHAPAVLDPAAPAGPALTPLVAAAWSRAAKAVKQDRPLHDIRIRVKRLRYAAEAAVPAFGAPAERLADRAADAQDVLGVHQDAVVAEQTYRRHLPGSDPPTAFALGLLAARARRRARRARRRWPQRWQRLRRRKLRAFLDA